MDTDSTAYRAAVLAGRAQALKELSAEMERLVVRANVDATYVEAAHSLVQRWSDLASWLAAATLEIRDEVALLKTGTQR
ncbi:hypothetical protein [Brevundimonas sp. PAMC22021]|uniref:hypothetical protein n=1 Tax=Brevundimonas sp. PAMC22021 TaxID=2861285 RepID=UPI001C636EE5|nr:hypothetical protein [Brevundimonas sp. PAMC22021]QYF87028.1 hypothetical protein KY493_00415 [Brevundimonas sp. PAMC22021]